MQRLKRRHKKIILPKYSSIATPDQITNLIERSPTKMLVVMDNKLVEVRYKLTLREQKLALFLMTPVKRPYDLGRITTYQAPIRQLINLLPKVSTSIHSETRVMFEKLESKIIKMKTSKGGWRLNPFLIGASCEGGILQWQFHPNIENLIVDLKKNFTKFDIRALTSFNYKATLRLYMLLKQFRNLKVRTITISDLERYLDIIGKYKRYQHLKDYILNPAQKELKLSEWADISFTYKPIRRVRKTTAIKFRIFQRTPKAKAEESTTERQALRDRYPKVTHAAQKLLLDYIWSLIKDELSPVDITNCRKCAARWARFNKQHRLYHSTQNRLEQTITLVFEAIAEYQGKQTPRSGYLVSDITWQKSVPKYLEEIAVMEPTYSDDRHHDGMTIDEYDEVKEDNAWEDADEGDDEVTTGEEEQG